MDQIDEWTNRQKMVISEKKTKAMLFNFTNNYQFTTRLQLKGKNVEMVDKMKILGTVVTSNLSWDDNCRELIRKVNSRMQLLRGVKSFGASREEMVHLWIMFCRRVIEQSCAVWGTSLTQENIDDLETTQKTFSKLVLGDKYKDYENAKMLLDLDSLQKRRQDICLKFAKTGIKNGKLDDLFPTNEKKHKMKSREISKFKVNFANTDRLKNSSIITMQNMLNEDDRRNTS